jgi:hypothetical protein
MIAFEGKLHILRSDLFAIVEWHVLAQGCIIGEPVFRDRPGCRQAGRLRLIRRDDARRLWAGSIQMEASDTWTPTVICPCGIAPLAGLTVLAAAPTAASERACRRVIGIMRTTSSTL